MLHWWLIPVAVVFLILLGVLYLVVKSSGGTGVRTPGRTLVDDPNEEPPFGGEKE